MRSTSSTAAMSLAAADIGPTIRPLKWWSNAALLEIETLFLNTVKDWRQAWIDDVGADSCPACEVKAWRAHEFGVETQAAGKWLRLTTLPAGMEAWVQVQESMADIFSSLFSDTAEITVTARKKSILMSDVADMAWMDLLARIMAVLVPGSRGVQAFCQTAGATIPAHHGCRWSGAVCLRLNLTPKIHIALHVGPDCAASLCSSPAERVAPETLRPPLIALEQAIDLHCTRLSVELAPVAISLGSLQALAVGDVLVLPHALKQALDVRNEHGVSLCQAYLGQCGDMRAVELLASAEQDAVSENQL